MNQFTLIKGRLTQFTLQQHWTALLKVGPNKLAFALPVDTLTWITGVTCPVTKD